jgi:hypothetical protein
MKDNYDNFVRWFKEPLSSLYKNPHAGFAIVILSLPILERYMREKSGVCEQPNLDDRFHQEFLNMFPSVNDMPTARKFLGGLSPWAFTSSHFKSPRYSSLSSRSRRCSGDRI